MGHRTGGLVAAMAIAMLVAAAPADALTCNWTGSSGTDWRASTANWDCGVIPDGNDDVVLGSGPDNVLIGTQNESAQTLTVTGGGGVSLSGGRTLAVGTGGFSVTDGFVTGDGTLTATGEFTHGSGGFSIFNQADVVLNGGAAFSGGTMALDDNVSSANDPTITFNGATNISAPGMAVSGTGITFGNRPFRIGPSGNVTFGGTATFSTAVPTESQGTITVGGSDTVTFFSDFVQTGGTITVQPTGFLDTAVTLQGGTLTGGGQVDGALVSGGTLSPSAGSELRVSGMTQTGGQTDVANGETLDIYQSGAELIGGTATIAQGGILQIGTSTTWNTTGGTLILNGQAQGNLFMNSTGRVTGTGNVTGDLTSFDGTLAPGSSAGTFSVGGTLDLGSGTVLEIEVGGPTPGTDFDLITVGGEADLNGEVEVSLLGGFTPPNGSTYQFLTSSTRDNTFDAVSGAGGVFSLQYPAAPNFGARLVSNATTPPPDPDPDPGGGGSSTPPPAPAPVTPAPPPAPVVPVVPRPPAPNRETQLASASPAAVATAFGLPSARRCLSRRNFVIRLAIPSGVTVRSARVNVRGRNVRVRRVGGRLTATVDLRGFPRGTFRVALTVTTVSGKTLRGSRTYRTCTPKRRPR